MNITHSFGKRKIQMDEKIVCTRSDIERWQNEARVDELQAASTLFDGSDKRLIAYYNKRLKELSSLTKEEG